MCTINEDHVMYGSWDLKHNKQTSLSFWATFCPLTLLTTWKFKILKNEKNARRYYILHKHTKNHDHMLYCSWDVAHDVNVIFHLAHMFCPFTHLTVQKIKILKKWKKKTRRGTSILHMCTQNYDHMMYNSRDMVCNRQTDGRKKWHRGGCPT